MHFQTLYEHVKQVCDLPEYEAQIYLFVIFFQTLELFFPKSLKFPPEMLCFMPHQKS